MAMDESNQGTEFWQVQPNSQANFEKIDNQTLRFRIRGANLNATLNISINLLGIFSLQLDNFIVKNAGFDILFKLLPGKDNKDDSSGFEIK